MTTWCAHPRWPRTLFYTVRRGPLVDRVLCGPCILRNGGSIILHPVEAEIQKMRFDRPGDTFPPEGKRAPLSAYAWYREHPDAPTPPPDTEPPLEFVDVRSAE